MEKFENSIYQRKVSLLVYVFIIFSFRLHQRSKRVKQGQAEIIIMCAKKEEYQPIQGIQASQLLNNGHPLGVSTGEGLPWSLLPIQALNLIPVHFHENSVLDNDLDPFLLPPPPSSYEGLFNTRARILTDSFGVVGSAPLGLQVELGKMTAQEIMDAKALSASKKSQ
ncbi:hypothetical protein F3Y22_tig00111206pilonHSYRG00028 [Hibiscus syriacus]|uniref:Uncharacterized protein n=1 Tax=Hibiscus syriacus TaxID=106335 RepID=A0A6A2YWV5_HIBSY|nr:hypothetical protein F3Y22_tig00111206pilonHSYRG00028 [Hibiscus syriacus]